jgi:HEPN domain-containing protein
MYMSAQPEGNELNVEPDVDAANEWLRFALADLAVARGPLPADSLYNLLCFHAQQTVEKSLKALLAYHRVDVPRTHSIGQLIDLLPDEVIAPDELDASTELTFYAVALRYPSDYEDVTKEAWLRALRSASFVYGWVVEMIGR